MELFKQIPLYRYLALCNESKNLEKKVLDCGAGGETPPLSLFYSYGYSTTGIDIDLSQVEKANQFGLQRGQNLNIQQGNMMSLEFEDESFSFVYSYNSIFHMMKDQVERAFLEMKRVTSKKGLIFVNFLTTNDFRVGEGKSYVLSIR
ncbi:putative methyltransferase YcgJ [compost metagenome]